MQDMIQRSSRQPHLVRGHLGNEKLWFDCAGSSGSSVQVSQQSDFVRNTFFEQVCVACFSELGDIELVEHKMPNFLVIL